MVKGFKQVKQGRWLRQGMGWWGGYGFSLEQVHACHPDLLNKRIGFFKLKFIEVIAESHIVVRNNSERFPVFPNDTILQNYSITSQG